jgi:hypothetical protein
VERTIRVLSRVAVVAAFLLGGTTACASEDDPDPPGPTSTTPTSTPPSDDPEPEPEPEPETEPGTEPATAEELLIGEWSTTDGGDAIFAYRFAKDGTYAWVGVISQQRESGVFQVTVSATGRYTVDGDRLLLEALEATRSREDPDDPEGDYVDQPFAVAPRQYVWEMVSDDAMTLTDETGTQNLVRES